MLQTKSKSTVTGNQALCVLAPEIVMEAGRPASLLSSDSEILPGDFIDSRAARVGAAPGLPEALRRPAPGGLSLVGWPQHSASQGPSRGSGRRARARTPGGHSGAARSSVRSVRSVRDYCRSVLE